MVIDMNDAKLTTLAQVREFLLATQPVGFIPAGDDASRYRFIGAALKRFAYAGLGKADKGLIRRYLARMTGYSRAQLTRLSGRYLREGPLAQRYVAPVAGFARRYSAADVALLAQTDRLHQGLSGPATRALLARAVTVYGDVRFERLAELSVSHLYNLRQSPAYRAVRTHQTRTRPSVIPIGVRRPPRPENYPGFIRIDSVHQGDRDGVKGVYHINAVDCVSQWEMVACCESLSEAHLLPVLERLMAGFPFRVIGFHADNGSEYVNWAVARLLMRLKINFTRSRPRRSNDNALVETKKGAIVRKQLGYGHIPRHYAAEVNAFFDQHLNPYLNFHRPCFYAVETTDAKGKTRKHYPASLVMTPFDRLCALPDDRLTLKRGITLQSLEQQALQMTDNQAAEQLLKARDALLLSIHNRHLIAA